MLDIPLDPENCIVAVIRIDDWEIVTKQLDGEAEKDLLRRVEEAIDQTLLIQHAFMSIPVRTAPESWALIVNLRGQAGQGTDGVLAAAQSFIAHCKQAGLACSFSIGVSDVCTNLSGIAQGYREASRYAQTKLLPNVSSVVSRGNEQSANYRREVREVIRYIHEHYAEDITIDSAAQHVFISPSYLMHLLRSELGKTFNECLMEYRIEVAKETLRQPGEKIYEVAQQVGYRDVKYFSRVFKKTTGLSPSEYVEWQRGEGAESE